MRYGYGHNWGYQMRLYIPGHNNLETLVDDGLQGPELTVAQIGFGFSVEEYDLLANATYVAREEYRDIATAQRVELMGRQVGDIIAVSDSPSGLGLDFVDGSRRDRLYQRRFMPHSRDGWTMPDNEVDVNHGYAWSKSDLDIVRGSLVIASLTIRAGDQHDRRVAWRLLDPMYDTMCQAGDAYGLPVAKAAARMLLASQAYDAQTAAIVATAP